MSELNTLVPSYYDNKQQLDFYKKQCDAENAKIKDLMNEQGIKDFEVDGIIAKYVIANKETMDEDKLLTLLKERGYETLIRTREYVDMDELEDALYHDRIDKDTIVEMDKCRSTKEIVQLRVSKRKEKKA